MDKKIDSLIDRAVELILKGEKDKVKAILLFGSHADDTAIWRSDIDLCVIFKQSLSLEEATLFRIKILGELPDKVDLQVFNTLPLKIKKSIAENHKVLFQSKMFDDFDFTLGVQKISSEYNRKMMALAA